MPSSRYRSARVKVGSGARSVGLGVGARVGAGVAGGPDVSSEGLAVDGSPGVDRADGVGPPGKTDGLAGGTDPGSLVGGVDAPQAARTMAAINEAVRTSRPAVARPISPRAPLPAIYCAIAARSLPATDAN